MSGSSPGKVKQEAGGGSGGGSSPGKVKQEDTTHRLHNVKVKFNTDGIKHRMTCTQPCTVLDLLKSDSRMFLQWSDEVLKNSKTDQKSSDENIMIQKGKGDDECGIPTHFPCTCIDEDELLAVSYEKEMVETKGQHEEQIQSRDSYSVFYINKEHEKNSISKKFFLNKAVKKVRSLCVYGKKGMTIEEALETDGRFIKLLITDFILTDDGHSNRKTGITQPVDEQHGKKFKLGLPRGIGGNYKKPGETAGASKQATTPTSAVVKREGISVKTAMTKSDGSVNIKEIRNKLCKQFPHLKQLMKSRFTSDSYQEALELKRENFGKIQQSFSEIHRVRKLLKLGESVCKVIVDGVCDGVCEGTGFVLFGEYILTNAHLFKGCVEGELKPGINVYVIFNYEEPQSSIDDEDLESSIDDEDLESSIDYHAFQVKQLICPPEDELDYVVLQLNPQGAPCRGKESIKIPPGLLKSFAPMPENGECCIIGHPEGKVKQMDPTCIIEKEKSGQAVAKQLPKDTLFTLLSITKQGIDKIMMGGKRVSDKVVANDTCMYHGSSGSPVFDARVRVFGLHSGGFVYGFPERDSVIELAQPVLTIFEHFVNEMKKTGKEKLLKRVKKEAKGNSELEKILEQL